MTKRGRPLKGMEIKWQEEVPVLKALLADGWSLRQLATRYKVSYPHVRFMLRKLGLQTKHQRLMSDALDALVTKRMEEALAEESRA